MTNTILTIIAVITAVLSCLTAIIVYRRERQKKSTEVTPPPSLKWLKFRQRLPTPPATSELKPVAIVGTTITSVVLVLSLLMLYDTRSFAAVYCTVFSLVLFVSYVFILRTIKRDMHASSYTRRERQVKIEGDYNAVFDRCENALLGLGARIILSDRDIGEIHARTDRTLKTPGERVEITVLKSDNADCVVTLASDSVLPTALFGSSRNSQNLDTLIKFL